MREWEGLGLSIILIVVYIVKIAVVSPVESVPEMELRTGPVTTLDWNRLQLSDKTQPVVATL